MGLKRITLVLKAINKQPLVSICMALLRSCQVIQELLKTADLIHIKKIAPLGERWRKNKPVTCLI